MWNKKSFRSKVYCMENVCLYVIMADVIHEWAQDVSVYINITIL